MAQAAPVLIANRLLSATRVALANDNTDVTGYDKANQFIVAFQIDEEKGPWNAQYTLRWRNVTDAGSFAAIAATGEMAWGTVTDLVNGTAVTTKLCQASGGSGSSWQNGEEVEGAATCDAINLADEFYTEIHFAVNPAAALGGKQYEFQLWDQTNGAAIGTGLATVTIQGAVTYTKTASLDSYLKAIFTKAPPLDGLLNKAGQTKNLSLDAYKQQTRTVQTGTFRFDRFHFVEGAEAPVVPIGSSSESDYRILEIGNVVWDPNTSQYLMVYTGYQTGGYTDEYVHGATSPDGKVWTKCTTKPLISGRRLEDPYLVIDGSTYYIFCEDKNGTNGSTVFEREIRCYSNNVFDEDWDTGGTDHGIVLSYAVSGWDSWGVSSPVVWKEGSTWYMLYEGSDTDWGAAEIGLSTSSSPTSGWTRDGSNPVLVPADANWFGGAPSNTCPDDIWKDELGYYHLIYHGDQGVPDYRAAYARSSNQNDLTAWTDGGQNPLSTDDDSPGSNAYVSTIMWLRKSGVFYFYYTIGDTLGDGIHLGYSVPAIIRTDDFNRSAESPLASPWQTVTVAAGGAVLYNNGIGGGTGGRWSRYNPSAYSFSPNQRIKAELIEAPSVLNVAIRTRMQVDSFNSYELILYKDTVPTSVWALKRSGDNPSDISGDQSYTFNVGDIFEFESAEIGSSVRLRVWINGALQGTWYDSDAQRITSGQPGISLYDMSATTPYLDNVELASFEDRGGLDAFLQKTYTKTLFLDSIISKAQAQTLFSDSLLEKLGLTRAASLDAILYAATTYYLTGSLDGLLQKTDSKTTSTDSLLQKLAQAQTLSADALLQLLATETNSLDAVLLKSILATVGVDGLLAKLGLEKTVSADSLLQKEQARLGSLDAFVFGTVLKLVSLDAVLQILGLAETASVDALLEKLGITKAVSLDSLLLGLATKTLGLDAILFSETATTIATSVDGLLNKVGLSGSSAIDSLLQKLPLSRSASVDAFLSAATSRTLGIDATLRKEMSLAGSLDALVTRLSVTKETALEALLLRLGAIRTTLMDGILSASRSEASSLDGYLYQAIVRTVLSDGLIEATGVSRAAALDAILVGSGEMAQVLSLDAWLQKASQVAGFLDAILVGGASFVIEGDKRSRVYEGPLRSRVYEGPKR
jgi:hypothetical protein